MSKLSLNVPVAVVSDSIETTVVKVLPSDSVVGGTAMSTHKGAPNVSHRAFTNCSIMKLGSKVLSVLMQPKLSIFTSLPRLLVNVAVAVNLFCGPNVAFDTLMSRPFELLGFVTEHEPSIMVVVNKKRIRFIKVILSCSIWRYSLDRIALRLTSTGITQWQASSVGVI